MKHFLIILISLLAFTFKAFGHHDSVAISELILRQPPPGIKVTAGYGLIKNNSSKDMVLSHVEAPWGDVEIHQTSQVDGLMSMSAVKSVTIEKNSQLSLKSGGLHLMVKNISKDLKEGSTVTLLFHFKDGTTVNTSAKIRRL